MQETFCTIAKSIGHLTLNRFFIVKHNEFFSILDFAIIFKYHSHVSKSNY